LTDDTGADGGSDGVDEVPDVPSGTWAWLSPLTDRPLDGGSALQIVVSLLHQLSKDGGMDEGHGAALVWFPRGASTT